MGFYFTTSTEFTDDVIDSVDSFRPKTRFYDHVWFRIWTLSQWISLFCRTSESTLNSRIYSMLVVIFQNLDQTIPAPWLPQVERTHGRTYHEITDQLKLFESAGWLTSEGHILSRKQFIFKYIRKVENYLFFRFGRISK